MDFAATNLEGRDFDCSQPVHKMRDGLILLTHLARAVRAKTKDNVLRMKNAL